ncbi:hypothetical protein EDC04DRAFT_3013873 [Pisolithus marmoratus]|nr:hypothetical protein EDC04DRAFT_3013873 [Pisolithus marmoratus]
MKVRFPLSSLIVAVVCTRGILQYSLSQTDQMNKHRSSLIYRSKSTIPGFSLAVQGSNFQLYHKAITNANTVKPTGSQSFLMEGGSTSSTFLVVSPMDLEGIVGTIILCCARFRCRHADRLDALSTDSSNNGNVVVVVRARLQLPFKQRAVDEESKMRGVWRLQVREIIQLVMLSLSPQDVWSLSEYTTLSIVIPESIRIALWRVSILP